MRLVESQAVCSRLQLASFAFRHVMGRIPGSALAWGVVAPAVKPGRVPSPTHQAGDEVAWRNRSISIQFHREAAQQTRPNEGQEHASADPSEILVIG
jgi:hypothetical protein